MPLLLKRLSSGLCFSPLKRVSVIFLFLFERRHELVIFYHFLPQTVLKTNTKEVQLRYLRLFVKFFWSFVVQVQLVTQTVVEGCLLKGIQQTNLELKPHHWMSQRVAAHCPLKGGSQTKLLLKPHLSTNQRVWAGCPLRRGYQTNQFKPHPQTMRWGLYG